MWSKNIISQLHSRRKCIQKKNTQKTIRIKKLSNLMIMLWIEKHSLLAAHNYHNILMKKFEL